VDLPEIGIGMPLFIYFLNYCPGVHCDIYAFYFLKAVALWRKCPAGLHNQRVTYFNEPKHLIFNLFKKKGRVVEWLKW
jgi:hypothetical protein